MELEENLGSTIPPCAWNHHVCVVSIVCVFMWVNPDIYMSWHMYRSQRRSQVSIHMRYPVCGRITHHSLYVHWTASPWASCLCFLSGNWTRALRLALKWSADWTLSSSPIPQTDERLFPVLCCVLFVCCRDLTQSLVHASQVLYSGGVLLSTLAEYFLVLWDYTSFCKKAPNRRHFE